MMGDSEFTNKRGGSGVVDNDDADEKAARTAAVEEVDDEESGMPMPPMREYGNTGPKGVLRDYADADERLKKRTAEKKRAMWREAEKNTFSTTTIREDEQREALERKFAEASSTVPEVSDEDEDEDAELRRLRAQRMAELKKQKSGASGNGRQKFVGGSQYVERLGTYDYMRVVQEEAYEDQLVTVLIHDDAALDNCDALTATYCSLAKHVAEEEGRDRDEVRMCAMGAKDALDSFEEQGLPALLVYKRGQLVNCAMGIAGPTALERTAKKFGIVDDEAKEDFTNSSRRQALFDKAENGIAGLRISDDEDDDDDDDDDDDE